jgi:hypothetical protein
MYYPDLSTYHHELPYELPTVLCVGWLDPSHPFLTGDCPGGFLHRMTQLTRQRTASFDLHVNVTRGIEPCCLCGDIVQIGEGGSAIMLGMSELWIPGGSVWYAAPSLIIHYISEHRYLPPKEFIKAVFDLNVDSCVISQGQFNQLIRQRAS